MKKSRFIKGSSVTSSLVFTVVMMTAGLFLFSLNGCYYDSEEELYPIVVDCDTTNVTYTGTVEPILAQNCYTCHAEGVGLGGVTIEGYTNLMVVVNDGRFQGAINHEPGFSPMPKDAPALSDCNLEKINKWISDGSPDN